MLCCAVAHRATAQRADGWTLDTTLRFRIVGAPVISPDGARAAVVISTPRVRPDTAAWQSAVHVYALDKPVSSAPIFTIADAAAPQWSPDGRWLAYASSRSGTRNVWRVSARGDDAEPLTTLDRAVGEFRFSPDSRSLALIVVDKADESAVRVVGESHRFARLYLTSIAEPRVGQMLTPRNMHVGGHVGAGLDGPAFSWAPDASAIVFTHAPSPLGDDWVNADVSIVDIPSGRIRSLVTSKSAEGGVSWSPDGQWIAMPITDAPATYALTSRIHLISPVTGATKALAESFDRRPSLIGWTADAQRVLIVEGRGVAHRLSALPVNGGMRIDLPPDSMLLAGATLGARGTMIGFVSETSVRPPEAFVATIGDQRARQVTHVQPEVLPRAPRTEVIRYRSTDNLEIEALLTYPIGWREGTRVPLLVIVHGGPPSAFTNGFTGRPATYPIAVFAQHGFAILRPNVRGSSGYGRDFRYANMRDWGGGDYRDVIAGVNALVARGLADSARVGLMGWSYGGYLTAIAITRTTRFSAASVGAGITDLVSYSGTADIPGFVPSYYGADFWQDAHGYRIGSAIANVANVTTPTLIQHGDRDERVPIGQGYQLYHALKRRGVPVRMLVYPGQGHGISDLKLQIEAARANLEWFERWLLQ